jgi:hypothetical protein
MMDVINKVPERCLEALQ